jgi:hypothetical protein
VRWRKVDSTTPIASANQNAKSLEQAFRKAQAPAVPTGIPEVIELTVSKPAHNPSIADTFIADPSIATVNFQEPVVIPQEQKSTRSSLLIKQPQDPPLSSGNLVIPPAKLPSPPVEPLALPPNALPAAPPQLGTPGKLESAKLEPAPKLDVPPALEALPPETNEPATLGEKSLPSPFPEKSPAVDPPELRSPSDRKLREPARLDDDLPPVPPKRADQSVANCELVRNFAAGTDIRNVQVNSSPVFVQGAQNQDQAGNPNKQSFIEKTPSRTWRGIGGEHIAEGKLVDLVYGTIVIEQKDGSRISYLQRQLSDADQVFVAEAWGVPVTCSLGDQGFAPRSFVESTVTWKASGACNKPLYFEDVQLERYGHEWGPVVQPAISTVRFFGDLAVLPYKMGIHPPNECQHPLGYHRPGSCAPWSVGPVPISGRGAVTQAAFVTGAAFALP